MVFVPRPPITAATLGIDGSVPRAVPTDLVVALLARLLPADLVQQALLLVVFVLAGWGVGRLAPAPAGGAAAAAGYVWNPYVAERLVLGHWAFLLGYALLPWVAGAALAVRREGAGGRPWPLLAWLGAAALAGSTAGLIATGVALAILGLRPAPTRAVAVLTFALAVNAPWWLPGLARPGGIPTDPAGVGAFGARADSPLGVVGSLATLGGIWNPAVWPAERRYLLLVLAALAGVAAALALGWRGLLAGGSPGRRGLVGAGGAGRAAGPVPVRRPAAGRSPRRAEPATERTPAAPRAAGRPRHGRTLPRRRVLSCSERHPHPPAATPPGTERADRLTPRLRSVQEMALQGGRDRRDRGAVIVPILVASLLGAGLAVGGAVALVKSQQSTTSIAPVNKPLVSYDQR